MAAKNVTVTTEDNITTETYIVKKDFWTTYSRPIIFIGGAIIILIGGWYGYKKLVKEPKEQKAAEMIFPAENIFDKMAQSGFGKDSVNVVLNGGMLGGTNINGVLKVISTYGGTDAGNRAQYLAGASYLQIGDFDKAIKYLKEFEPNGAYQMDIKRDIMLGHAYAEKKQSEDAFDSYKKAASINEKDEAFTSDALVIAAAYAESLGKTKDAIELYQKVKDNYPASQVVATGEIDKNLAKLGVTK